MKVNSQDLALESAKASRSSPGGTDPSLKDFTSQKSGCFVGIAKASHASSEGSDPSLKDFNSQNSMSEGCSVRIATASHAAPGPEMLQDKNVTFAS
eukprot:12175209-Karenia_brevis.AAC.1